MRIRVPLFMVLGVAFSTASLHAEGIRLHGAGALARALGGHQKDELGFGGEVSGAAELGLSRALGLSLELGGLYLSEGDAPDDPRVVPEGDASAYLLGAGVRVRPFASSYANQVAGAAGLWLSGSGGLALTNGLGRPMASARLGYDFLFDRGSFGIGPMLGYLHVFQPNDELRPDDENVGLAGLHVVWDSVGLAPPEKKPAGGDRDGDGIADAADECPDDPEDKDGFEDTNGCPDPDNDADGIADGADHCPNEPEDKDGFEDTDGCPDRDNDADGIADAADECPDDPEDKDGFEDADGCPDRDNDADGIADAEDLCPDEPETKNNYADHDGCPDEEQIRVVGDKIILDDRVHFHINAAIIRRDSYPLLERLTKLLSEHPEYVHIAVEGHTDTVGPDWFNRKLSQSRAESVLEFLVERGIVRERLSAEGFADTRPLVEENSEYARLMNRRVEFRLTRRKKTAPGESKSTGALPPPPSPGLTDIPKPPPGTKLIQPPRESEPESGGEP
jgi:outer membrane protein OmpA-like peptidoglycan-associated protein